MYCFLDDGSFWKKTVSKKIIKWTHIPRFQKEKKPYNGILETFNEPWYNIPFDKIDNFCDSSLIYSPGYPYEYMNEKEREHHGYIQCLCCPTGHSCGKLRYSKRK
tara:strand:+ start:2005 stop:2319 length:315 start_codon:yes stop_codon:yes gene_type:complete